MGGRLPYKQGVGGPIPPAVLVTGAQRRSRLSVAREHAGSIPVGHPMRVVSDGTLTGL